MARAVLTRRGFVLPVLADLGGGRYRVLDPCERTVITTGTPLSGAHVVLDPGHGGRDSGAIGPSGLKEKVVNAIVARKVKTLLEATGATVVLAATNDQETTLAVRARVATALRPLAFVSIHHNAEPDGPSAGPGAETYYQISSSASKRLAGLLWEEEMAAFSRFSARWTADRDHGAKYRKGSRGDYYAILRLSAGVTTALSEAAYITNPTEEALLRRDDFLSAEAAAIVRAIERLVRTRDAGSGFTVPYPRTQPAGGGGTADVCVGGETL